MDIVWQRLIDGMIKTLEGNVLPALEDAYARGQVFGVMSVLSQLRVGAEWLQQPLVEQVGAQRALFARVHDLAAKSAISLPTVAPRLLQAHTSDEPLWDLRDEGDRHVCQLLHTLGELVDGPAGDPARHLQGLLYEYMQGQLAIEARYVVKPEYSQVTSGSN